MVAVSEAITLYFILHVTAATTSSDDTIDAINAPAYRER